LTPSSQDFELLAWRSIVESELTFFEGERERCLMNAIVLSQYSLGLTPKIFDAVDAVFSPSKFLLSLQQIILFITD